jgi:hypothetical protein
MISKTRVHRITITNAKREKTKIFMNKFEIKTEIHDLWKKSFRDLLTLTLDSQKEIFEKQKI